MLPSGSVWVEEVAEPLLSCPEINAHPPRQRDLQRAAANARRNKVFLCYALTLHEMATWFSNSTDLGFDLGFIYTQISTCYKTGWDINRGFAAQENGM